MSAVSDQAAPPALYFPVLTFRLLWRFWPQLTALWLVGMIAEDVLNEIAVRIGFLNQLAGLSTLTLVVLAKLVVIVALFEIVRPGLPTLDAASRAGSQTRTQAIGHDREQFTTTLALALVPFFAYYAAWGFLGDTIREYSKLALDLTPFGENSHTLDVSGGWWLVVSVAIAWVVRRLAKVMHKRSRASVWPTLIVVCEANWAFIGLYVLSGWKDEAVAWAASLPETLGRVLDFVAPVGNAAAAVMLPPPVEAVSPPLSALAVSLFFYALYPVVWLTLAALVYGYDINSAGPLPEGRLSRTVSRWKALPQSIRDFIAHFVAGTAKRYRALAEGIGLTLGAGATLIVFVIISYRFLDWLAAWAWYGSAHLIGAHDLALWQVLAHGLSILFGSPSAPGDGILVMPLKICLLAAALELGFAGGRQWRSAYSAARQP